MPICKEHRPSVPLQGSDLAVVCVFVRGEWRKGNGGKVKEEKDTETEREKGRIKHQTPTQLLRWSVRCEQTWELR